MREAVQLRPGGVQNPGWACPTFITPIPPAKSMKLRPSVSMMVELRALAIRMSWRSRHRAAKLLAQPVKVGLHGSPLIVEVCFLCLTMFPVRSWVAVLAHSQAAVPVHSRVSLAFLWRYGS